MMVNKVFQNEIGDMLEVYMDDMIVNSAEECQQMDHLDAVFACVRQYNTHLNPEKCTFRVKAGKFQGLSPQRGESKLISTNAGPS